MRGTLEKVLERKNLEYLEMKDSMEAIMEGTAPLVQVAAFLAALRVKGESPEEIRAAAEVMRDKARRLNVKKGVLLDIVGTGGDGKGTFNISTAAALVVAAGGVAVAKHGNRAVSSRCGSADVLEELGVGIFDDPSLVVECIEKTNFGFIYAPYFHKAMRNVAGIRKALGVRTIFNILGPLTNPARVKFQVLGVYSPHLVRPMAEALAGLGVERAVVVCGFGSMDEFSLEGPNKVCLVDLGSLEEKEIRPEDAGLKRARNEFLAGKDAKSNAKLMERILSGEGGPLMEAVIFNAAVAFVTAGTVCSFREGAVLAREVIASGKAYKLLEGLRAFARETRREEAI